MLLRHLHHLNVKEKSSVLTSFKVSGIQNLHDIQWCKSPDSLAISMLSLATITWFEIKWI